MYKIIYTTEEKAIFKKIGETAKQTLKNINTNKNISYNIKKMERLKRHTEILKVNTDLYESGDTNNQEHRKFINKLIKDLTKKFKSQNKNKTKNINPDLKIYFD